MDEDWDSGFTTGQPISTDLNNNAQEKKSFGFEDKMGFGNSAENNSGFSSGLGKENGFGGDFRNRDGDNGCRQGGFRNRDGEQRDRSSGFGGGFRNRDGDNGGRQGGFGGGFRNRDGEQNDRSSGFGGGFRNRDGEQRDRSSGFGGGFRNRDGEQRDRSSGFGGGFRNRDGEQNDRSSGFGGGFRNRDGDNGGRQGGFGGGFRNRDGEQRDRSSGFGGGFRNRDGEQRDRSSGFGGGFRNRDEDGGRQAFSREGGNGDKVDEPRRERYIPDEVEDSESTLFKNFETGVNFTKQAEIAVEVTGANAESVKPLTHFKEAQLTELLMENVQRSGYEIPTPVQKYAIPIVLQRRDLMACAQTGSGKTAAFVLPIMTNILNDGIESSEFSQIQCPQALILSPTRELALQIFRECKKFSYKSMLKSAILYGGVDTRHQLNNLEKGCNILVATPGRLLDVLEKGKISLEKVKYFVLDEADRMLSMGFEEAVRSILSKGSIQAKGDRVTLMFSATFPKEIQQLAQDFLHDYLFLAVGVVGGANADVTQSMYKVSRFEKRDKCVEILNDIGNDKVMIFVEHKKQADILGFFLIQKGYPTTTLHGDRLQSQREIALNSFKTGKNNIIVCTSVAARGLDIEKVNHVINYDLPQTIDEYVHRIGRTGRCGNLGKAISFYDEQSDNDRKLARPLVRIFTQAQQEVPQWLNEAAEDSVGTAFHGSACNDDLRGQFTKLSVAPTENTVANDDDDAWD